MTIVYTMEKQTQQLKKDQEKAFMSIATEIFISEIGNKTYLLKELIYSKMVKCLKGQSKMESKDGVGITI